MIAQLILSALLAAILLYAWTEYRRSPVVAFLTVAIAASGLYFVWMPEQSRQLAELVGIGRPHSLRLGLHQPGRAAQPASEAADANRVDHHAGAEDRDHRRAIAQRLIQHYRPLAPRRRA
jgi:cyanate permease